MTKVSFALQIPLELHCTDNEISTIISVTKIFNIQYQKC